MKRVSLIIATLALAIIAAKAAIPASATTVVEHTSGYILIQTERNGEAWYVEPSIKQRYFLGRPGDALHVMYDTGLGISNANLAKIPVAGSSETGDVALRQRLSGKILLQVEDRGQAWYVYPGNTHRYSLGRPDDAWALMRQLGLGISNSDLAQIPEKLDPEIAGAGNIAGCTQTNDTETAALLSGFNGNVYTLGNNAYTAGSTANFTDCYQPTWGGFKSVTYPSAGDIDYATINASGYFNYFGHGFGPAADGYYRYTIGQWNVISLNSNCAEVGGCEAGSSEYNWLQNELTAFPAPCTMVYMHGSRFSSGTNGNTAELDDFWKLMNTHAVDVVLGAGDHDYERFAPLNGTGAIDHYTGLRAFVVGTGGQSLTATGTVKTGSQVRVNDAYGVLKLTLHPRSYSWQFATVPNGTVRDSGSYGCH